MFETLDLQFNYVALGFTMTDQDIEKKRKHEDLNENRDLERQGQSIKIHVSALVYCLAFQNQDMERW
jgi:hypothetical protein